MEAITVGVITGVLSAAAGVAAEGAIQEAAKDVYVKIKELFRKKGDATGETALTQYESDPDTWAKPLEKSLTETKAGEDERIVKAVKELTALIKPKQQAAGKFNIQAENIQGAVQADRIDTLTQTFGKH